MTTIHEAIALAARLASEAEAAGITVGTANTFALDGYAHLTLMATDKGLTPALAVEVGVTSRHVDSKPCSDGLYIEAFEGVIDGVSVTVQGTIPALEAVSA